MAEALPVVGNDANIIIALSTIKIYDSAKTFGF